MWILVGLLSLLMTGCSMARGVNELLPGAQFSRPVVLGPSEVQIFKDGATPRTTYIRVAKIAAHGNGYADMATLEQTLRDQAAMLGADLVIIAKHEVTNDETIGTYGGGLMISESIKRPHLYGVACRSSKMSLGIQYDYQKDGIVQYVRANSLAEKIGIVEGDRILAVNGHPLHGDPFLFEREIASKDPGERVSIEYLKKNDVKVMREVTLQ
jgi:hypothetical protein